jgi:hypothetical protein
MDENQQPINLSDLELLKNKLLTKKELLEEKFIHQFMNEFEDEEENLPGTSADLGQQGSFDPRKHLIVELTHLT